MNNNNFWIKPLIIQLNIDLTAKEGTICDAGGEPGTEVPCS